MQLTPAEILLFIGAYFLFLMFVAWWTGRKANSKDFYVAGKNAPWILVAIGMIGTSLSGVTFISIPGKVGLAGPNENFAYMQMVFGYLLGYLAIATVLLPLYYKLNLISIYGYLGKRFGRMSQLTGSGFFLLSRLIGSAFRLFLVAMVLQTFVMDAYGLPFWLTVALTVALIWIYTFRGGIKTIVWTDVIQTLSMLLAVALTILAIGQAMDKTPGELISLIKQSPYSKMFYFEHGWSDPNNFFKQFFSGALIALVMSGLDQDMMQKNLSCRNLRDAQKNMFTYSLILIVVNLLFLSLGALLYLYAEHTGLSLPAKSDQLYPLIALHELSPFIGLIFLTGLLAAAYSSADSALASLTTAFSLDFLQLEKKNYDEKKKQRIRIIIHLFFSLLLLGIVVIFRSFHNDAVINKLFILAGYTYGPLLGLFAFGLFTKRQISDRGILPVALIAPVASYFINAHSAEWLGGFKFGFLIVLLNGILTFAGLWLISAPQEKS